MHIILQEDDLTGPNFYSFPLETSTLHLFVNRGPIDFEYQLLSIFHGYLTFLHTAFLPDYPFMAA